ncbi:hypothetical protein ACHAXS_008068 [Conticribra weissflogii]
MPPILKAIKKIISRKATDVTLKVPVVPESDLPPSGIAKIYKSFDDNIRSLIDYESNDKIFFSVYVLVALLFLVTFVPLCYRAALKRTHNADSKESTEDIRSSPVVEEKASAGTKEDNITVSTSSSDSLNSIEEEEVPSADEPPQAEDEVQVHEHEQEEEILEEETQHGEALACDESKEIATHKEVLREKPLLEVAEDIEADCVFEQNTPEIEAVENLQPTVEVAECAEAEAEPEAERQTELACDNTIVYEADTIEEEQQVNPDDTTKEDAVSEEATSSTVPHTIDPLETDDTTTPLPSKERSSSATSSEEEEGSVDSETPATPTASPPNSPGGRGLKKKVSGSLKKPVKMLSATMKRINSSQSLSSINGNK